jgi:DNA-binding NarL/FixJ family response regulator
MIRILIIDDHEMAREGLRTMLGSEPDFEIVGLSASANAIEELVERTQPDVALVDAHLPGVSGPEAVRRIVLARPSAAVIVVSGFSDDDLVDECIDAGAKGYMVKGIERSDLKQAIRAVHRGEGAIAPSVAGRLLQRIRLDQRPGPPGAPPLNKSQIDILALISEGLSNREIADRVHLSENTVKSHIQEIFRKLGVHNRVEAALRATREGWI